MTTRSFIKKVFLLFLAMLGSLGSRAQTCISPITLTVNTGFTAIDSTNLTLTYYKFTATNTQHAVKFWIKGLNSRILKGQIKTYTNNCGSLSTSGVVSYRRLNGDTLYVDIPSTGVGIEYLIELRKMASTYLVNQISIGNNLLTHISTTTLSCPSASTCQPSLPCDLVCNGDFECLQFPVGGSSQIAFNGVWNWNDPAAAANSSSDLLSATAATTTGASVPCNAFGYQNAYSNNNYAGFIAYYFDDNYVEYIQTHLASPMITGKKYEISFYASQAEFSTVGINGLAAYLTNTELVQPTTAAFTIPAAAVETNTALLNDQANWQKITMSYTASGGEEFLTIGRPAGSGSLSITPSTFTCGFTNAFTPYECYMYIDKVSIIPVVDVTVSASPSTTICGVGTSLLAAGNYSNITYTWTPGPQTGSNVPIYPSTATVYTLTSDYLGCTSIQTIAITVNTACCTSTIPPLSSYSITGTTITGPKVINQDLVIYGTNAVTAFQNGEFLIAPNVKITVTGTNNEFALIGAHLYACSTMWEGINVTDGNKLIAISSSTTGNSNLIEDAITAVNVASVTSAAASLPIEISNTIFNKNYTAISIGPVSTSSQNFYLVRNVFTSRTLTFTPTSWPSTSTVSPELRYTAGTNVLTAPYPLQSAAVSSLKSPYAGQPANTGIIISNVGGTTSTVTPGALIEYAGTDPDRFNLFDALGVSIDVTDASLSTMNNVFQNAQQFDVAVSNPFFTFYITVGGTAIRHTINSVMNARLNLSTSGSYSATTAAGNRFWQCHRGVEASNVYQFNMDYATFRSAQTSTASYLFYINPGHIGVQLSTNRFNYAMRYNEFTNIKDAINVPVSTGTYDIGSGNVNGIYANNFIANYNTIAPQLSPTIALGTNFSDNAITVSSPNTASWTSAGTSQLFIQYNNIDRSFRGITLNGMSGYSTTVSSNTVVVSNDVINTSSKQYAIGLTNLLNKHITKSNVLSATNSTNTNISLLYSGANATCAITCNTLNTGYTGFEFNSANPLTTWKGNDMTTHTRGMSLINTGTVGIGTQGSSGNPSDNKWNGTWTGNNGTYVDGSSNAVNSKLWVKSTTGWFPPFSGGPIPAQSYVTVANTPTTTGTYACGSAPPAGRLMNGFSESSTGFKMDNSATASDEKIQFISDNTIYRFLEADPEIKNSEQQYIDFCTGKAGSSIDQLNQVETAIYNNDLAAAEALNNSLSVLNTVEANYKAFYSIYLKQRLGSFTDSDNDELVNLCSLCPGTEGAVVYQARALYNQIHKTLRAFNENCDSGQLNERSNTESNAKMWNVDLFPNPTNGELNLVSKADSEKLFVVIKDISGKIVYSQSLLSHNFFSKLDLNLMNGIYLVTISNNDNESVTKKLVITK